MEQLIHITATYSNAVLVAILPHVSDFAKKLDLPIPQPITVTQVERFNPMPYKDRIEGGMWLTNGDWFVFSYRGYVDSYSSLDDVWRHTDYVFDHLTNFTGQTRMTTNEMVALARETLLKLGYPPEVTRADAAPKMELPGDLKQDGHFPYCKVTWEFYEDDPDSHSNIEVKMNTQKKTVVGLILDFARTNKIGTPLKVDVVPELESDYRKPIAEKMFIRSNAPARLPQSRPSGLNPPTNSPARSTNSIQ